MWYDDNRKIVTSSDEVPNNKPKNNPTKTTGCDGYEDEDDDDSDIDESVRSINSGI